MTIYDHPITNPREYRGEPAKCPLWVLIVSVLVLFGLLCVNGPEKPAQGTERSVSR